MTLDEVMANVRELAEINARRVDPESGDVYELPLNHAASVAEKRTEQP